jgi:hypothetical protein
MCLHIESFAMHRIIILKIVKFFYDYVINEGLILIQLISIRFGDFFKHFKPLYFN